MEQVNKIYVAILFLLIALFPFSKALPNILLPILIVLFLADIKNVSFKPLKQPAILCLYAVMVYLFLKGVIRGSLFSEFSAYSKYIAIIVMPVLFLKVKDRLALKKVILAGIVAMIVVSIIKSVIYYFNFGNFPFGNSDMVSKLLVLERPYAGFYAVCGTLLSFYLIKYMPGYKRLLMASAALCVFFILLVAARMSLLSLVVILGIYLMFYASISVSQKGLIILFGVICLGASLYFSKSMQERFFINSNRQTAIDYEPRVVIWDCTYDLLSDADYNAVFGFNSYKTLESKFLSCYDTKITYNQSKKDYFLVTKFNSHNQFYDYMLAHGFIGLLLLMCFMVTLFFTIRKNFYYLSIVFALTLFMVVENIFFRQMGCYIFSIFTALLLINNNHIIDEED